MTEKDCPDDIFHDPWKRRSYDEAAKYVMS